MYTAKGPWALVRSLTQVAMHATPRIMSSPSNLSTRVLAQHTSERDSNVSFETINEVIKSAVNDVLGANAIEGICLLPDIKRF